jgi:hypothetical protein
LGTKVTELTKQKLRNSHLGKKYKPMSEQGKRNISIAQTGLHIGKNNSFYGKHHTEKVKNYLSKIKKGIRVYIMTNKTKEKLRKLAIDQHKKETYEERMIINNKISNSKYGTILSKEHKLKISNGNTGKIRNSKHRTAYRLAQIKRIERQVFNGQPMYPCIGVYESQMLDALEKCFGYEIKRQYKVNGYFLDGYCPMLNLAIEIDEKYHQKAEQLSNDIYREQQIKNELHCNFVRIEV